MAAVPNSNFLSSLGLSSIDGPGAVIPGTTIGATNDASDPTPTTGNVVSSVWYSWRSSAATAVYIAVIDASFDLVVAVYEDTNGTPSGLQLLRTVSGCYLSRPQSHQHDVVGTTATSVPSTTLVFSVLVSCVCVLYFCLYFCIFLCTCDCVRHCMRAWRVFVCASVCVRGVCFCGCGGCAW